MNNNVFAGIEQARTSDKLPYIQPGNYLLEVESIKLVDSRTKGAIFCAEFKVLDAKGEGANPIGSRCSHLIVINGNDSALGNIKSFVQALTGDTNITKAMVDALVGPENPAAGETVRAEAFLTKTKRGTDFTRVSYSPAESAAAPAPAAEAKPTKAAARK